MATADLPSTLRRHLSAVAARVRLLRALRGLSVLVLTLALLGGAALLADYFLGLPAAVRVGLSGAWAGLGLGLLVFGVVVPLTRRIDLDAVAAAVEEQDPDLGERLTTTGELAGGRDSSHS